MPSPTPELRVVVNPYHAVDHKGRPAGALLLDPVQHRPYADPDSDHRFGHPDPSRRNPANRKWEKREHLGATRKSTPLAKPRTQRVGNRVFTFPVAHDHAFTFSKDVQTVPNTQYYQRAMADQAVFAADLESWVGAGFDPQLFQDPALKLKHAKEGAIAQFVAHHGDKDPRLATLALHWDGHVEQSHPVGIALSKAAADKAAAEAKSKAAPPAPAPAPSPAPAPAAAPTADAKKGA